MYPILALAEVLTEGLVFFRRASTVYRVANTMTQVSDMIDSLTGDKLRYHTSVKGDDAYLWLLGRNLMIDVYKSNDKVPPDTKMVINVPVKALIHNQFIMTSPDARSMVNNYLYALGAEWQLYDDDAYNKMFAVLDSVVDKFIVEDPVWTMFEQDVSISDEEKTILNELGIDSGTLSALNAAFKEGNLSLRWKQALTRSASRKIYKVETALGTMLDGAKSVLPLTATEIPLSTERIDTGLSLNAGYLYKQVPTFTQHEQIARGRAITREMTEMMSKRVMEAKGFVSAGGKWTQLEDVNIQMVKPNEKSEAIPTFVENKIASVTQTLASRVEDKLSAMARLNRIKKLVK